MDFGDAATLRRFASIWLLPLWLAVLAAIVPTLTLSSGLGFYYMLKDQGAIVVLGVAPPVVAAVFTVAQDGIEFDAGRVPSAGVRGRRSGSQTRAAGDRRCRCHGHERLRRGSGMVGYVGMLLINCAMLRRGGYWRLIAGAGLLSAVAIIIASTLSPMVPFAQAGFPIGFILLRVWMIVMAVMMIRGRLSTESRHAIRCASFDNGRRAGR